MKVKKIVKASLLKDKDYNLWVVLDQAWTAIFNGRGKELAQYDITAMKAWLLFIVKTIGDEATPAQIARVMHRRAHSVSGLLDRMDEDGLITRAKDLDRKNLVRVTITDKGKKALKYTMKRESIHSVMSVLSQREEEQLYSLMVKIRDRALKEEGNQTLRYP